MRFMLLKLIGFIVTLTVFTSSSVQARDSYFEPITSFELAYTDNVVLSPTNPQSQTRGRLTLGLDYTSAESPNDRFSAGLIVDIDRYTDDVFDFANYTGNLDYFKSTPRRDFDIAFIIRRGQVLTDEFDDTGAIRANPTQERLTGTLGAAWTERFSPRWAGELGVRYQRREYPGGDNTRFVEFDNWYPNVGVDYSLSERTSLFGQLGTNFYNPLNTPTDQEQRSDRLLVGVRGSFSERSDYNAGFGWENYDFENIQGVATQQQDTDGAAWDVWGRWENELSRWTLGTSRLGEGSSRGTLTRVTKGYIRFDRDLSARINFYLLGELGQRQFPSDPQRVGLDRDYATAELGLYWRFAQKWRTRLRYRYRQQEFITLGGASTDADSNAVGITISYEHGRL